MSDLMDHLTDLMADHIDVSDGEEGWHTNAYVTLKTAIERINELEDKVAALENPGWEQFISLTTQWLEKYPPNIFDGSSGDKGPLFVVALRNALAALKQEDKT